jgi:hypothetical protein
MLPVLVILFLISYGLLTRLVVEQDRVITFQLSLIRQMLGDARELANLKGKMKREQNQTHPSRKQTPESQEPHRSRPKANHETRRPKLLPERPPIPASDAMDERRAEIKI